MPWAACYVNTVEGIKVAIPWRNHWITSRDPSTSLRFVEDDAWATLDQKFPSMRLPR
jgi:hypothetical protein